MIDAADYELVSQYRWYWLLAGATRRTNAKGKEYAYTRAIRDDGKKITLYMHRLLYDGEPAPRVDHRDGDGLNNRRANLRGATNKQNAQSSGVSSMPNKTSLFKGVQKFGDRWKANIQVDGRSLSRIRNTEVEAAQLYDSMASEHFGEFAMTNQMLGLLN